MTPVCAHDCPTFPAAPNAARAAELRALADELEAGARADELASIAGANLLLRLRAIDRQNRAIALRSAAAEIAAPARIAG